MAAAGAREVQGVCVGIGVVAAASGGFGSRGLLISSAVGWPGSGRGRCGTRGAQFVNRIDEIVRFRALTEAELAPIVEIQLEQLRQRLATRRIELEVTDAALARLATLGYDPAYGARPLRRVIQREVADRLATLLLEGDVTDGSRIRLDVTESGIALNVVRAIAAFWGIWPEE